MKSAHLFPFLSQLLETYWQLGGALWTGVSGKIPTRRWHLSRNLNKAMDGVLRPARPEYLQGGGNVASVVAQRGARLSVQNKKAGVAGFSEEGGVTTVVCPRSL